MSNSLKLISVTDKTSPSGVATERGTNGSNTVALIVGRSPLREAITTGPVCPDAMSCLTVSTADRPTIGQNNNGRKWKIQTRVNLMA